MVCLIQTDTDHLKYPGEQHNTPDVRKERGEGGTSSSKTPCPLGDSQP